MQENKYAYVSFFFLSILKYEKITNMLIIGLVSHQ